MTSSSSSKILRVGWHREHFLSPLLQLAAKDEGKTFELVECPGGTGEMQVKMREGEIDICIALTDALIAGIANGQTAYKIVGQYIASPLRWAMTTGKDSQYNTVDDLKGSTFGISRLGSGSQVMASVLSLNQGWSEADQPRFKGKLYFEGQFKPLRDSVNSGTTSIFLWEWFTTKPYVDSGEVRFIGHVDTPWPSWCLAATHQTPTDQIHSFLSALQPYVTHFDSADARAEEDVRYVVDTFGQQEKDVREWLGTVRYAEKLDSVKGDVVLNTLSILTKAGVVQHREQWDVQDFVRSEVASIV